MKLLISPTSPYARKVRVVILEKNIDCEVVAVVPWNNPVEVVDNNPLRQIPILLTEDVGMIVDSRTICEYLDSKNETAKILPQDFQKRMQIKTREAIAEGAMNSFLSIIMAKKVAPEMQNEAWKDWLEDKVGQTLNYFDQNLPHDDCLDIADITLACLLGILSFRAPDFQWKEFHPKLDFWFEKVSQRPSFSQTIPKD